MPKQIVIEPCLINYGDDRGGVAHVSGEFVDVPKETAATLARTGRALFIDKKDDPDKNGNYTASDDVVAAAKAIKKTRAEA